VPVVLVVEDDEPLQEIVHDALKEGGFDLTTVSSGREAVAMIESGVVKYSALVTDINLKGPMKGWEVARLVRQIDPCISDRLHDRRCRRRLGVGRRAQQHSAEQAVCSSAISYGGVPVAQHRLAELTIRHSIRADRRAGVMRTIASARTHHVITATRCEPSTMGVRFWGQSRRALVTPEFRLPERTSMFSVERSKTGVSLNKRPGTFLESQAVASLRAV
jgi:CheY-like chemotaxis protein